MAIAFITVIMTRNVLSIDNEINVSNENIVYENIKAMTTVDINTPNPLALQTLVFCTT
ncbi:hypothetical protein GCM10009111_11700 [Colwellia asteriadis]|uniref:Uncharacterized protein n=1 Tax=Colwellia asteriadis TaxID=517723 RepID=A0ABP3WGF3_9GAMM